MSTLTRNRTLTRLGAVVGGTAVVMAAGVFPAVAADGDVQVTNTETVKVYTDATGKVTAKRLYEQLALTGDGNVQLANPVETAGLRNLNGFSGFDVEDGEQIVDIDVDGEENIRSVSTYEEDLPLDIDVEYVLDGEPISPKSLVGESGDLEVTYTIRNATNRMQTISYTDGSGGTIEEQAEVMLPMVGSLSMLLPANFRDIDAEGASAAGDGENGTRLSWTMTLLAPLGDDTVELGYKAEVVDAVVPDANVTALPVNPLDNPTLSNAAKSYKGGADTGEELAAGAAKIDSNLLKLRDGASDLLAGLIKLRAGADQLSAGLQDEAAPGAQKLAAGAGDLNDGLGDLDDGAGLLADGTQDLRDGTGELSDGAGRLDDGAGRLADGTQRARAGAQDLTGGLKQISDGLDTLAGTEGLGAAADGITELQGGVETILKKVGDPDTDGTLVGGLFDLVGVAPTPGDPTSGEGLLKAEAGAQGLAGGLQLLVADPPENGLPLAKGGVDQVIAALQDATKAGGDLDALQAAIQSLTTYCNAVTDPDPVEQATLRATCNGTVTALAGPTGAVEESRAKLEFAAGSEALGAVSAGLQSAISSIEGLLIPGAQALAAGLTEAREGAAQLRDGSVELRAGLLLVDGGLARLEVGLARALDGVVRLANGANTAYEGSGTLTGGLGELADGAGQLNAGTGDLVDGVGRLDAGANQLADGAGQLKGGTAKAEAGSLLIANGAAELATGLFAAADGSGLLADGLATAAEGAPKLVDGAQRLSDEGTKKLVEAGEDTAQNYGEQYALIMAGAERAQDGKMVVGAPEDSIGLAAYSFDVRGEDGEGTRNLARALGGLAVLGAGAGLFALRRRLF